MLSEALLFLSQQCSKSTPLLIACSGGLDSMSLAQLLLEEGYSFALAHVNFQLRGDAAAGDQAFVEQWARQANIQCFSKRVNTKQIAKERGLSTQLAAREIRYEWFKELLEQQNFAYILMGHHLNDTIETSIFHLAKGAGIGLRGLPVRT